MKELKIKQAVAVQYTDLSEDDNVLTYKLFAVGTDGYLYEPDFFSGSGWKRMNMTINNEQ